jgi:RNA polymerase sigma-70 factor, ECF subfamily
MEAAERRKGARADESARVAALRAGDEQTFMELVRELTPGMRRLALGYVRTPSVAEDVVQEAWLGVLKGIGRFEGRSSLKTWIYTIVANIARTRGRRESFSTPFSSFATDEEPSVDPDRFVPDGHWASPPEPWRTVLDAEARAVIDRAIDMLPEQQRLVIELRDVEGWPSDEVCNVLDLSETNQRVLLHRARSKVRAALEDYFGEDG